MAAKYCMCDCGKIYKDKGLWSASPDVTDISDKAVQQDYKDKGQLPSEERTWKNEPRLNAVGSFSNRDNVRFAYMISNPVQRDLVVKNKLPPCSGSTALI